ncbi:MAG: PEGA domain-containing protein [Myxococcota bacterium]
MSLIASSLCAMLLAQVAETTSNAIPEVIPLPDDGRVIVLANLSSLGSTADVVSATERVLVSEFRGLLGSRLRTIDDLAALSPEVSRAVRDCEGSSSCLLEIVAAVGWDTLIVGNLAGLGDQRAITLRQVSAETGEERGQQSVSASGDERELIVQIRAAAVRLLAPERYVGTIEFVVEQVGVQVLIDGELIGSAPLARNRFELEVGRHAIEASGEGLVPFSEVVDIRYGEKRTVTIVLPANTVFVGGDTPYYARWWTWAIAGAGVTGLGLGGYFGYLQQDTVGDIEDRAGAGTLTGDDAFLFQDQEADRDRALLFYGIGGALTLTAATLLSLDLFE